MCTSYSVVSDTSHFSLSRSHACTYALIAGDREVMTERCFRSHKKDIANTLIPNLPEAHALSACDTVSSLAAGSKATVFLKS